MSKRLIAASALYGKAFARSLGHDVPDDFLSRHSPSARMAKIAACAYMRTQLRGDGQQNFSYLAIARILGMSNDTVRDYVKRFCQTFPSAWKRLRAGDDEPYAYAGIRPLDNTLAADIIGAHVRQSNRDALNAGQGDAA